ncbi:hypothetical protein C8R45DRAFT_921817 [Mycena sanguinolenta]|nr:hypothetical protein C8R45DRAFT_921817 [Mycena sanguinolenta]
MPAKWEEIAADQTGKAADGIPSTLNSALQEASAHVELTTECSEMFKLRVLKCNARQSRNYAVTGGTGGTRAVRASVPWSYGRLERTVRELRRNSYGRGRNTGHRNWGGAPQCCSDEVPSGCRADTGTCLFGKARQSREADCLPAESGTRTGPSPKLSQVGVARGIFHQLNLRELPSSMQYSEAKLYIAIIQGNTKDVGEARAAQYLTMAKLFLRLCAMGGEMPPGRRTMWQSSCWMSSEEESWQGGSARGSGVLIPGNIGADGGDGEIPKKAVACVGPNSA